MPEMKTLTVNGVKYDLRDPSKAPAGYGLGISGQLTNDWNEALLSGFYYGKTNSPDGGWWAGAVYGEGANYAFQHLYKNGSNLQKVRECYDGTWREWVDVGPSAFAPSGFGLGKTSNENMITSISALDALKVNCNFLYASDANPIMVGSVGIAYAYGRVDAYDGNRAKMTIVPVFPEYKSIIVRYAGEGGTWGEWEWFNPPMVEGVTYRTAERIEGKAVYKKAVNGTIQYRLEDETDFKYQNVLMGAAPTGFGLGTDPRTSADILTTNQPGWFRTTSTTANISMTHGAGIVLKYVDNEFVQLICRPTTGEFHIRATADGGNAWEWATLNAPNNFGTEYRTAEQWNGKQIYTKIIDCGALPNASSKTVSTGLSGATIIRTHLVSFGSDGAVRESPYITSDGTCKIRHNVNNLGGLNISASSNEYADATNYCQIWYTK